MPTFYAVSKFGTAGPGASYGGAQVVESDEEFEAARSFSSQTETWRPFATREEAEAEVARIDKAHDRVRGVLDGSRQTTNAEAEFFAEFGFWTKLNPWFDAADSSIEEAAATAMTHRAQHARMWAKEARQALALDGARTEAQRRQMRSHLLVRLVENYRQWNDAAFNMDAANALAALAASVR